jgi:hypothetical protein
LYCKIEKENELNEDGTVSSEWQVRLVDCITARFKQEERLHVLQHHRRLLTSLLGMWSYQAVKNVNSKLLAECLFFILFAEKPYPAD